MGKIVMIIPWFGKFPKWFDLYLFSCSRQKNIDFWFFTDSDLPSIQYANTYFEQTTFSDYCKRISESLSIDFHPLSSYKLCDVKPFYGIIHEDLIKEYEFWGFGDIDVVYGDLDLVIKPDNLRNYDLITTHTDRISGHFTIMRRESKYTRSCLQIKDWKSKLTNSKHLSIDEDDWVLKIYPELKWIKRIYRFVFKPLHIPMRFCFKGLINKIFCNRITRIHFHEYGTTPVPGYNENWTYDINLGKVYTPYRNSIPYLHFLFFKKTPYRDTKFYWRNDFYRVPTPLPKEGNIYINNSCISYKK